MSSRGFLLRMHDDDSYEADRLPLSPNIVVSRADFFDAQEGGKVDNF